jgi:hypothetical protein
MGNYITAYNKHKNAYRIGRKIKINIIIPPYIHSTLRLALSKHSADDSLTMT